MAAGVSQGRRGKVGCRVGRVAPGCGRRAGERRWRRRAALAETIARPQKRTSEGQSALGLLAGCLALRRPAPINGARKLLRALPLVRASLPQFSLRVPRLLCMVGGREFGVSWGVVVDGGGDEREDVSRGGTGRGDGRVG